VGCACTRSCWIRRSSPNEYSSPSRRRGGGRLPDRRRWQDLAADQARTEVRIHPRSECRGRPLRPPYRDEPVTAGRGDSYVNVLRGAMAVDSLDSCGVYFGIASGQCMRRPMPETAILPLSETFWPRCRWRSRHCHDPITLPQHLRMLPVDSAAHKDRARRVRDSQASDNVRRIVQTSEFNVCDDVSI
jgi:hypothetical protein